MGACPLMTTLTGVGFLAASRQLLAGFLGSPHKNGSGVAPADRSGDVARVERRPERHRVCEVHASGRHCTVRAKVTPHSELVPGARHRWHHQHGTAVCIEHTPNTAPCSLTTR